MFYKVKVAFKNLKEKVVNKSSNKNSLKIHLQWKALIILNIYIFFNIPHAEKLFIVNECQRES